MFTTGGTVGLAEWIIDDTYLVFSFFGESSQSFFQLLDFRRLLAFIQQFYYMVT